ncbi:ATP-dependent Clp protease ATP-binding subunit [candidate division WOR-3 bacterium]|nr:ATP-dependent Clp protease ATP-binding subunit [candidate division WOR-3 bacterium]
MDERFTKKLIDVVKISKDLTREAGLGEVTPVILLLAILKHGNNIAVTVIEEVGVDIELLENRILRLVKSNEDMFIVEQPIGLSEDSLNILEEAKEEALMLGRQIIGTEHLLLSLLKAKEGSFIEILKPEELDYYLAKQTLLDLFDKEKTSEKDKEKSKGSVDRSLEFYTRDLTDLAKRGRIDPVIGRESEMERVIQTLCRRKKNNPVLVGEPGVGKTAIVEGLAQRIVVGAVPKMLQDKKILSMDLASVIAGTKYRGQFEKRLKQILESLKDSENILFIDEMHTIVGAGAAEGAIDASNMLKPVLARGEIQTIGATTTEEYRKYIEKDGALERRLQMILIDPPTINETIDILDGIKRKYEDFHKVTYTDEVIKSAVKLSCQYIADRNLPDKAIDVLDETGAKVRLRETKVPDEIVSLEEGLRKVKDELLKAREEGKYEVAIELRDRRDEIEGKLEKSLEDWGRYGALQRVEVTEDDIREVISLWTGIPLKRLREEETERLLSMEDEIKKRLVGQDEAIRVVSKAIRRSRAGLRDLRRPLGAFLFLGPTGVGKTELAKQLAKFLFNTEEALIRIDMSEFMERFNVSKLIGAPPGYVGYDEGGILTEAVRRRPYSVILLDEIEKSHPDVYNVLLQVFDEGILTDAYGRKISFKNTVIIMTSNIGTKEIMRGTYVGFKKPDKGIKYAEMKDYLLEEIKERFSPEFLNRIDESVVFQSLYRETMVSIVDIFFNEVRERVEEKGFEISLTDEAKEFLIEKGFDLEYGARPLKRVMQRHLEDKLAEGFLKGKWKKGNKIVVSREGDNLVFFSSRPVAEVL